MQRGMFSVSCVARSIAHICDVVLHGCDVLECDVEFGVRCQLVCAVGDTRSSLIVVRDCRAKIVGFVC